MADDNKSEGMNVASSSSFQKQIHLGSTSLTLFEKVILVINLVVFFIVFLVMFYCLKRMKSKYLSKSETAEFFIGGKSTGIANDEVNGPYEKSNYELLRNCFTIDETSSLGSGAFGKVCRGTVKLMGRIESVAVKMTKVPCPRTALKGLLYEIKILSFLGKHPHIVELKGAYTSELRKRTAFVFLELCELGSLQEYLRERNPSNPRHSLRNIVALTMNDENQTEMANHLDLDQSLENDLFRWSREIANGMEFIASKHIVHLDLATRNVLLTYDKRAKITDFGLSRRMYDYQTYIKKEQEPLPWRWMAPESFRRSEFTEKSDVWAYGITLWEIFELGNEPYPGLPYNVNFPTRLERGFRLGEPTYNRNNIYSRVMLRCWNTRPEGRPTFTELLNVLSQPVIEVCASTEQISDTIAVSSVDSESNHESETADYIDTMSETSTDIKQLHALEPTTTSSKVQKCLDYEIVQNANVPTFFDSVQLRLPRIVWAWLIPAIAVSLLLLMIISMLIFWTNGATETNVELELHPQSTNVTVSSNRAFELTRITHLIQAGSKVDKINNFLRRSLDGGTNVSPDQFQDIAAFLVEKNLSQIFNTPDEWLVTPFHLAVHNVEIETSTLSLLKNKSVNFNAVNNDGWSVLLYATMGNRSSRLISDLVSFGSDPMHVDKHNMSMLHRAALNGNVKLLKFFFEKGLDLNGRNDNGQTPLHSAVDSNENVFRMVRFLLKNGARGDIVDYFGNSPRDLFTQNRQRYHEKYKISACFSFGTSC